MTTYNVSYTTIASTVVKVEADSPEDARIEVDDKFNAPTICAQCSGWGKSAGELSVDLSGEWDQDESEHGVWEEGS